MPFATGSTMIGTIMFGSTVWILLMLGEILEDTVSTNTDEGALPIATGEPQIIGDTLWEPTIVSSIWTL